MPMMSYNNTGIRADLYNDYTIYVDPRQYERICRRRIQRDRQSLKRGKPRNTYVQISVRDEYFVEKPAQHRFDPHSGRVGYTGVQCQNYGYKSQLPFTRPYEYPYTVRKVFPPAERGTESYSDVTTSAAGSSEASSYPCSFMSSGSLRKNIDDPLYGNDPPITFYTGAGGSALGDLPKRIDHSFNDGFIKQDVYSRMGSMVARNESVIPRRVSIPDNYVPPGRAPEPCTHAMPKDTMGGMNIYPTAENVGYKSPVTMDVFGKPKLMSESYSGEGGYPGEVFSVEPCASEAYPAGQHIKHEEGGEYYPQVNKLGSRYENTSSAELEHADAHQQQHDNRATTDAGGGNAGFLVTERGAHNNHISCSKAGEHGNPAVASDVQKKPLYKESMYATETQN